MPSAAFAGRETPAAVPADSAAVLVGHDEVVAAWGAEKGTLFQAASISKPVAALMALRLAARRSSASCQAYRRVDRKSVV